jgi:alkanesulfonate monooxygenase SsuD/methylene tetrahydromethanopterin reductase-like flavin-dependent oxidoreductase (luciferase family)/predicted kinase
VISSRATRAADLQRKRRQTRAVEIAEGTRLPDPILVVLVGASGSGKTTWAAARYAPTEIVSSDALRGMIGSGPADLDASGEAFALLDQIVAGRTRRRLTTVVDTLGLDRSRRLGYLEVARAAGMGAAAVMLTTDAATCRRRNATRDRPVPAPVLAAQQRAARSVQDEIETEGWDRIVIVEPAAGTEGAGESTTQTDTPSDITARAAAVHGSPQRRLELILQISRFPWGEDPAGWLTSIARRAEEVGISGIALMDHLIQIPQVGRAWEPIPEPWVTLGLLAGTGTRLKLGTLVSPVTFRPPGIIAKTAATLNALSGGRTFVGVGAGWWNREHAAYGLPFPSTAARLDLVETTIETCRALWATGSRPYAGERVTLPETTCYPRPVADIPIIVGGAGERRTLRIAARLADACNLPADPTALDRKIAALRAHCAELGRDPSEVQITVLDLPLIGTDRADTTRRVERHRGRTPAATFAARHHAGTIEAHRRRYEDLAERGVSTAFVSLPDLAGPADLERLAPLVDAAD